ncbi:response regulator [Pseudooceanicola atlanticus]|uniref:Response regulatory domain-containing protein n=1 Tax=Pseudooceanicola atlanticus TaxID=1461694 RepID=A0A0A0EFH9_9RHOB|nr:response regulator [Pseudooceanicola atlanticus]KGM49075.1 hypothetical protein ATO9_10370 [Pseudooceanicola atlanticus]
MTGAAKIRCLVVEDSEVDRLRFSRIFSHAKPACSVDFAPSLSSARTKLMDEDYQMIFLDNSLRDGLGADFAMELAGSRRMGAIPIVMVSDWPSPFMYAKARSANVKEVLTKDQFNSNVLQGLLPYGMTRH